MNTWFIQTSVLKVCYNVWQRHRFLILSIQRRIKNVAKFIFKRGCFYFRCVQIPACTWSDRYGKVHQMLGLEMETWAKSLLYLLSFSTQQAHTSLQCRTDSSRSSLHDCCLWTKRKAWNWKLRRGSICVPHWAKEDGHKGGIEGHRCKQQVRETTRWLIQCCGS